MNNSTIIWIISVVVLVITIVILGVMLGGQNCPSQNCPSQNCSPCPTTSNYKKIDNSELQLNKENFVKESYKSDPSDSYPTSVALQNAIDECNQKAPSPALQCQGFNLNQLTPSTSSYQTFNASNISPTCFISPTSQIYVKHDYKGYFPPSCIPYIPGCMDSNACNYNPDATVDDKSCEYTSCAGCTDKDANNYDVTKTIDDGSCTYDAKFVYDEDTVNLVLHNKTPIKPESGYNDLFLVYKGVKYADLTAAITTTGHTECQTNNINPIYTMSNCSSSTENDCYWGYYPSPQQIDLDSFTTNTLPFFEPKDCSDTKLRKWTCRPYLPFDLQENKTTYSSGGFTCANWYGSDPSTPGNFIIFGKLDEENLIIDNTLDMSKFQLDENAYFIVNKNRIYGCTDPTATNYSPSVNGLNSVCCNSTISETIYCDTCQYPYPCANGTGNNCDCDKSVTGCMNKSSVNYDPNANVPTSTCIDLKRNNSYVLLN